MEGPFCQSGERLSYRDFCSGKETTNKGLKSINLMPPCTINQSLSISYPAHVCTASPSLTMNHKCTKLYGWLSFALESMTTTKHPSIMDFCWLCSMHFQCICSHGTAALCPLDESHLECIITRIPRAMKKTKTKLSASQRGK